MWFTLKTGEILFGVHIDAIGNDYIVEISVPERLITTDVPVLKEDRIYIYKERPEHTIIRSIKPLPYGDALRFLVGEVTELTKTVKKKHAQEKKFIEAFEEAIKSVQPQSVIGFPQDDW